MNTRGQAALEYLMTYGWALIVIAIVVGVLVFIVSSPAGNVVCNSDDPAKVMVKASQVNSSGAIGASTIIGTIKVTNLTGGDATSVTCVGGGGFDTENVTGCPSGTWDSGETIDLTPVPADTGGTHSSSTIDIAYIDYASLSRTATITCSGPITIG